MIDQPSSESELGGENFSGLRAATWFVIGWIGFLAALSATALTISWIKAFVTID